MVAGTGFLPVLLWEEIERGATLADLLVDGAEVTEAAARQECRVRDGAGSRATVIPPWKTICWNGRPAGWRRIHAFWPCGVSARRRGAKPVPGVTWTWRSFWRSGRICQIWWQSSRLRSVVVETLRRDDVDLVVLNTAPPLVRHEVVAAGRRLFAREAELADRFEERAAREAFDTAYLRRVQQELAREARP